MQYTPLLHHKLSIRWPPQCLSGCNQPLKTLVILPCFPGMLPPERRKYPRDRGEAPAVPTHGPRDIEMEVLKGRRHSRITRYMRQNIVLPLSMVFDALLVRTLCTPYLPKVQLITSSASCWLTACFACFTVSGILLRRHCRRFLPRLVHPTGLCYNAPPGTLHCRVAERSAGPIITASDKCRAIASTACGSLPLRLAGASPHGRLTRRM
jgi:hypothetical protein